MQRVRLGAFYDADYFERGPQSGKSLYENYRYMPEKVEPAARWIAERYRGLRVLDYGCAKGFLVKALVDKGVDACGYDVSEYAVENGHPDIKDRLYYGERIPAADVVIGKDVLEHVPHHEIVPLLIDLSGRCKEAVFVVPLGDSGKYRIPCYHDDASHLIAESEHWWLVRFMMSGWSVQEMTYDMTPWKAHWMDHHKKGNAVFTLRGRK